MSAPPGGRGVVDRVREGLVSAGATGPADLARQVSATSGRDGQVLDVGRLAAVAARVEADLWGLGPLEQLVRDPEVTDVLVNGPGSVYVERSGRLEQVPLAVGQEHDLRALATRLAARAGRRLDDAAPWVDVRIPGGLRLHAVLPPVARGGTHLSLRALRPVHADLDALQAGGSVAAALRPVLEAVVRCQARFLVSGGTGVGKTTLLAALLSRVPSPGRIVVVEDVAELAPATPHLVSLEGRPPNVEGRGAVTLADLVRQALRMRPDWLVVGECRGREVVDLLAALNTGHAGCGTVHANAAADVPARLEALGALAGLSPEALAAQAVAALDVVIHLARDGGRRLVQGLAVVGEAGGRLSVLPAATVGPRGDVVTGPGWSSLAARLGLGDGVKNGVLGEGARQDGGWRP